MKSYSRIALASAGLFGLLFLQGCGQKADENVYPASLPVRVELKDETHGEEIRYVTYAKDGVTPVSATVEYKNGNHANLKLHANGAEAERHEYFPERDGKRVLRLYVRSDDKNRFLEDRLYREDGTLFRNGMRLRDGTYEARWYHLDGTSVMRHKLVDDKGNEDTKRITLLDERIRLDGSFESVMKLLPDGRRLTTFFSLAGTRTEMWLRSNVAGGTSEYSRYYGDGNTLSMKVSYGPQFTQAEYFRPDGTMRLARFKSIFGEIDVFVFDEKGDTNFRQRWRFTSQDNSLLLRRVLVYSGEIAVKSIVLQKDGKTAASIETAASVGDKHGTLREFRADGTLASETKRDATGNIISQRKFTSQQNIREKIADEYLRDQSYEEPPSLPKVEE